MSRLNSPPTTTPLPLKGTAPFMKPPPSGSIPTQRYPVGQLLIPSPIPGKPGSVALAMPGVAQPLAPKAQQLQQAMAEQMPTPASQAIPRPLQPQSQPGLVTSTTFRQATTWSAPGRFQVPDTGDEFRRISEASRAKVNTVASTVGKLLAQGNLVAAHGELQAMAEALTPVRGDDKGAVLTPEMDLLLIALKQCKPLSIRAILMGSLHHFGACELARLRMEQPRGWRWPARSVRASEGRPVRVGRRLEEGERRPGLHRRAKSFS